MEYFNQILEWPVIVQGALGSFLFWLLFKVGEKTINFSTDKFSKDKKVSGYFALSWYAEEIKDLSSYSFYVCIYGAFHYFIKALIILVFTLLVSNFNYIFASMGYIISAYFLFRSISYLPHTNSFGSAKDAALQLKKLDDELG